MYHVSAQGVDERMINVHYYYEHMFQMTAVAPQTHLKLMSEVVNHPDTLFLPDGMNLLGDGHFQFSSGLRMMYMWCFKNVGFKCV